MSVDTRLYVSDRWELRDIKQVIKTHLGQTVAVKSYHEVALGMFMFDFGGRSMWVHTHTDTPIGTATMLSLGMNQEAIKIMRTIAGVLGGILEESDCEHQCEMIRGSFWDEDGLPYFLKYAIIHDKINPDNIEELKTSIEEWHKKIDH